MDDENEIRNLQIAVVLAGHSGDPDLPRDNLGHGDPRIRSVALSALERPGLLDDELLSHSMNDEDPAVRRRIAEIAAAHPEVDLGPLLQDTDPLVVEMAAWSCGEQMQSDDQSARHHRTFDERIIDRLIDLARNHEDPLVRESSVAALGAIGGERALPTIIACCSDKPAVRRRAVLALAPFSGELVDSTLHQALEDRDWQVRQAAEDLLGPRSPSADGALDDQEGDDPDPSNAL